MMINESAIVFPLLPGKRLALAKFVDALMCERRQEHDQTHDSVCHESWFLQATPQGDIVVIYLQTPDPTEVFADLAVSSEPFVVWFREQVMELSGVDLTLLPPFNLPQRVLHRTRC